MQSTQRVPARLPPYSCFRSIHRTEVEFSNAPSPTIQSVGPLDTLRPRPRGRARWSRLHVNV